MIKAINKNQIYLPDVIVLIIIVIIAIVNLPRPFSGDQALAMVVASNLNDGAVLYKDVWDPKQPGIFIFYLIAGNLFGFDEIGVHIFELFYMVGLSIALLIALKDSFKYRWLASLVPLFTVGAYYIIAYDNIEIPTLVESIIAFPVFICACSAVRFSNSFKNRGIWLFLSGLMGGIVIIFKLVYLPLVASFWLVAFIFELRKKDSPIYKVILQFSFPILLGLILPTLPVIWYFIKHNIMDTVYFTYFEFPPVAVNYIELKFYRFRNVMRWYFDEFSPLMALAVFGIVDIFKDIKNDIKLNMVVWSVIAFVMIMFQRSWTFYQFMLLVVPIGVLATFGINTMWHFLKNRWNGDIPKKVIVFLISSAVILFLPFLADAANKIFDIAASPGKLFDEEKRIAYQCRLYEKYSDFIESVSPVLQSDSVPGEVFVIGNPLIYYLSGRKQSSPYFAGYFVSHPELWERIFNHLKHDNPPYVFIAKGTLEWHHRYTPTMIHLFEEAILQIKNKYDLLEETAIGYWYVLPKR